MKLVIELNDNDLRRAVSEHVGATVSNIATEVIQKQVEDIIALKIGRVSDAQVQQALETSARNLLTKGMDQYSTRQAMDAILASAAKDLLRSTITR